MDAAQPIPPPAAAPRGAGSAFAEASRLVGVLKQRGLGGPLFLIASDDAVGRFAPAWAEAFSAAGWVHRVRVVAAHAHSAAGARELATEAGRFGAGVIVAAGTGHELGVGRHVAQANGLVLVPFPADGMVGEGGACPLRPPAD